MAGVVVAAVGPLSLAQVPFGGLVLIAAGAALAVVLPETAVLSGSVSALRGSGAGMAMPATAALAAGSGARPGSVRQPLAAWWAAVTVASLAVLPGLTRTGQAVHGWRRVRWPGSSSPMPRWSC